MRKYCDGESAGGVGAFVVRGEDGLAVVIA
jgi:hypothetical protein